MKEANSREAEEQAWNSRSNEGEPRVAAPRRAGPATEDLRGTETGNRVICGQGLYQTSRKRTEERRATL